MNLLLGSDHGGYDMKLALARHLSGRGIPTEDVGCFDRASTDYPDYARRLAGRVAAGEAERGILICTTGNGMAIAANRFPGVRAALCMTPDMARMARRHNNANVLVLGGGLLAERDAVGILDAWLDTSFESGSERHARRVSKLDRAASCAPADGTPATGDRAIDDATRLELERRRRTVTLIASENYVSRAVRAAQGGGLTDKYADGYPGRRCYDGCEFADRVEEEAIARARTLFGAEHANVQPYCGSLANLAVYAAVAQPGETILAMDPGQGGHHSHGGAGTLAARLFHFVHYGVRRDDGRVDYDEAARLAREHRPRLLVAGTTAYPRALDFARFRSIADEVGAVLMVDMAHIAGLVAGGVHASPVPFADAVTGTTHKTLRGPRGGLILSTGRLADGLDRELFPGLQGGPLLHVMAAKAVCFAEAARPDFKAYAGRILANARDMAEALAREGFRLVTGGTDTHLILADVTPLGVNGRQAATALKAAGITVDAMPVPFDPLAPHAVSGIRLGTPAMTTRGMGGDEARELARIVAAVVRGAAANRTPAGIAARVAELAARFPPPA